MGYAIIILIVLIAIHVFSIRGIMKEFKEVREKINYLKRLGGK